MKDLIIVQTKLMWNFVIILTNWQVLHRQIKRKKFVHQKKTDAHAHAYQMLE